ncbi:excinuclease ABC subunit C [Rhodococcus sp. 15-725-2-2b]|uniref:excinuclease ABC subunit UvrC n=1 Tax=unclassified Rhodococcus (in: high G+C Gram-positive bacteria) TaxID=192944 RepID=UPI000B9C3F66|nr:MULTISPECIES: excinuclease ABC subunit UvrC [unclassified Rhodococcus (in: high G+C Gram-positive bacteria)]OZC72072.1 excinuclease ABC subunit C [Rhodococcus sp. 06-469-3-2]OZD42693.1 excinuclease ABC subunit C [Rhodococcus sp. 06-1477-1A]OZE06302.1 excinuclease ABC subunit C [Rhodococcus sp. 05-2255-3B1]OZE09348.1 excinuclease ABC subunit C [Rhodococcus sp. 05-2255-3C]OZE18454.1 excinuclease ABC subunit C [Rhodococcus sp. 05-2255-2A2]
MSDPATYRPATGTIPVEPGVYKFRDPHGRVVYVGKAKSLRSRLNSYFADIASLHPRTRQMVTTAASVEWTVVTTEVEALQLEYNWIKEFDPRFNVRYRDDKSYPMLAVTMNEEFPRLFVYRGPRRKGVRYFGPYAHAWAIRETLDLLLRVFPARTCSTGVFKRHNQIGRPCLLGYIDKCSAPCVGRVSAEEHRATVEDFCDFLAGKTDKLVRQLEKKMQAASEDLDFETAARLRDDVGALRRALEKQAVVLGDGTDADLVAFATDALEAAVQVFHVRGGRVRGQRGWVVEKAGEVIERQDEADLPALVEQFLTQFYGEQAALSAQAPGGDDGGSNAVPREVLVPVLPDNADEVQAWLSELRGSNVTLRVPQRGDKKALAETVERNAKEALQQHKLKRAGDFTSRSAALQGIQEALDLDSAPLRIECIDISHVQGTDVVASLVVFEDGLPRKSDYRHYAIKEAAGDGHSDDVASIAEVTRRRFLRHSADGSAEGTGGDLAPEAALDPQTGRPRKFAYPPNLFVVDGGAPQVAAAAAVLDELGVTDVAVVGLAKRLEEVWVPGEEDPVILPRTSESLYLLQRVRDEAHRFAITFHRSKRSRRMTASALDSVRGLGESRRTALVAHFGSVANLKRATVAEIVEVPGIGETTAKSVLAALCSDTDDADVGDDGSATATTSGENTAEHAIAPRVESAGQAS